MVQKSSIGPTKQKPITYLSKLWWFFRALKTIFLYPLNTKPKQNKPTHQPHPHKNSSKAILQIPLLPLYTTLCLIKFLQTSAKVCLGSTLDPLVR